MLWGCFALYFAVVVMSMAILLRHIIGDMVGHSQKLLTCVYSGCVGSTLLHSLASALAIRAIRPPTSTIRSNFSATVAPNIANPIPILKGSTRASKWVWGLLCLAQRLPRNSNG